MWLDGVEKAKLVTTTSRRSPPSRPATLEPAPRPAPTPRRRREDEDLRMSTMSMFEYVALDRKGVKCKGVARAATEVDAFRQVSPRA
jgi:hypothetical protein